MAESWQHWLSPRPLQRSSTSVEPQLLAPHDSVLYEFLRDEYGRSIIQETHFIDNKIVRDGLSGPMLHIHWQQAEFFKVEKGVLGIWNNEKELVVTKDDGVIKVPAGARHRFWAHKSGTEDLVFKVWVKPRDIDHPFDENFLRNMVGYQRDCQRENIRPSVFQLMLMTYNSSTLVTPPFWMPIWILMAVQYVLAVWIGSGLLGYKASYPEYTRIYKDDSQDEKKII